MPDRCPGCTAPPGRECFAQRHGLSDWCADLAKWGEVVYLRSIGAISDDPSPEAERLHAMARDCPHADRPYDGCACVDRRCGRSGLIVSGMDCLLCVSGDGQ